jgi:hypothetical protein
MIVLAHILGMPVEEFALPWVGAGVGAGMLLAAFVNDARKVANKLRKDR